MQIQRRDGNLLELLLKGMTLSDGAYQSCKNIVRSGSTDGLRFLIIFRRELDETEELEILSSKHPAE